MGEWITGAGNTNAPIPWSIHPQGIWAEYIEYAPPGTRINLGDPLERCEKCGMLFRPNVDKACLRGCKNA